MQEISTGQGRTVLFVSHNMASVKKLCTRGIVLEYGKVSFEGDIDSCIEKYIENDDDYSTLKGSVTWDIEDAIGTNDFKIMGVSSKATTGEVKTVFLDSQPILIEIETMVLHPIHNMRLNFTLLDKNDVIVFVSSSHTSEFVDKEPGLYRYEVKIPDNLLNSGTYTIALQAGIPKQKQLLESTNMLSFDIEKVMDYGTMVNASLPGVVAPNIEWLLEKK